MKTQDAILNRCTAHVWGDEPVPDDVLQRGLAAAHMAPCHRLTWPWRFTLPGSEARKALLDLGVQLKTAKSGSGLTPAFEKRMLAKLWNPALIVVSRVLDADPMRCEEDYAACACAIQNLCLSVFSEGYHSKWSTGGLTRHEQTYATLKIPTDTERIIGFVWIGVPARPPSKPSRPDLQHYIRRVP